MRKKVSFFLLAFCSLGSIYADNIIIHTQSGNSSYSLKSVKEINFEAKGFNVVTDSKTSLFSYDDIMKIDFMNSTGIDRTTIDMGNGISMNNGIVENEGKKISVYSVTGRLITTEMSRLDVSSLPKGTYIVSSDNRTIKFVK